MKMNNINIMFLKQFFCFLIWTRFIYEKNISLASGMNHISLDVSSIDPGMYLLLINTPEGILRQKVNK